MKYEYLIRFDKNGSGMSIQDTLTHENDLKIEANTIVTYKGRVFMVWELQHYTDLVNGKKVFIVDLTELTENHIPEPIKTKMDWDDLRR